MKSGRYNALTFFSIDWDFFIWHAHHSRKAAYYRTDEDRKINFAEVFDHFADGRMPPELVERAWRGRKIKWNQLRLELEKEWSIRPDRGCTSPQEFAEVLNYKIRGAKPILKYFESHDMAFYVIQNLFNENAVHSNRVPIHIIHLDAHHDLGYGGCLVDECKNGASESGSWLYRAIYNGYVDTVDIVYPNWKGKSEWIRYKDYSHIREISGKIRIYTWNTWKNLKSKYTNVAGIGVAKSTAWTPPWLDSDFDKFVNQQLPASHISCFDCENPQLADGRDACKIRKWEF